MERPEGRRCVLTPMYAPRKPPVPNRLGLVAKVAHDYPDILALVVSGNASAEQALNAGAMAFIGKPYEPVGVVETVRVMAAGASRAA